MFSRDVKVTRLILLGVSSKEHFSKNLIFNKLACLLLNETLKWCDIYLLTLKDYNLTLASYQK